MSDAQELPSGETGRLRDPSELPRPQMWPQPPRGQQPVPISGRDDEDHGEKAARAKLPMAWTAVGLMIAGVVLVALAVVLQSWIPLVPGGARGPGRAGPGQAVRHPRRRVRGS